MEEYDRTSVIRDGSVLMRVKISISTHITPSRYRIDFSSTQLRFWSAKYCGKVGQEGENGGAGIFTITCHFPFEEHQIRMCGNFNLSGSRRRSSQPIIGHTLKRWEVGWTRTLLQFFYNCSQMSIFPTTTTLPRVVRWRNLPSFSRKTSPKPNWSLFANAILWVKKHHRETLEYWETFLVLKED